MKVARNTVPMLAGLLLAPRSQGFRVFIGGQEFLVSFNAEQGEPEQISQEKSGNNTTIYNALGQTVSQTDQAGNTTSFTYDIPGHNVRTTYADGSFTQPSTYDAAG